MNHRREKGLKAGPEPVSYVCEDFWSSRKEALCDCGLPYWSSLPLS